MLLSGAERKELKKQQFPTRGAWKLSRGMLDFYQYYIFNGNVIKYLFTTHRAARQFSFPLLGYASRKRLGTTVFNNKNIGEKDSTHLKFSYKINLNINLARTFVFGRIEGESLLFVSGVVKGDTSRLSRSIHSAKSLSQIITFDWYFCELPVIL